MLDVRSPKSDPDDGGCSPLFVRQPSTGTLRHTECGRTLRAKLGPVRETEDLCYPRVAPHLLAFCQFLVVRPLPPEPEPDLEIHEPMTMTFTVPHTVSNTPFRENPAIYKLLCPPIPSRAPTTPIRILPAMTGDALIPQTTWLTQRRRVQQ